MQDALIIIHAIKPLYDNKIKRLEELAIKYLENNKKVYWLIYPGNQYPLIDGVEYISNHTGIHEQNVQLVEKLKLDAIKRVEIGGLFRNHCVKHINRQLTSGFDEKEYKQFNARISAFRNYRVETTLNHKLIV